MRSFIKLASVALAGLFSAQSWALNIFACEPEWGSLAKELAPEATIYSATTAYQDPHYIEARPSLVAKARKADMLVCTGAEMEVGWLPVLLRQAGNPRIQADQPGHLMAAEQVERLEVLQKVTRSMGDVHAGGNPHVHLDPHRLLQIAEVLRDRLMVVDAENSHHYRQRFVDFAARWALAIEQWEQQAAPLKGLQYVAYHKNFSYFAEWLGLQRLATLEPKPGVPPSAKHVQKLHNLLEGQSVLAVLTTAAQPTKNAERLARKLNSPAVVLPFSPGAEGAEDLYSLFQISIDRLLAAR
jgi:zinc/manganese transport system substrate-binding protein